MLDLKTYRKWGVTGPRDNVFAGPAVALDGPDTSTHYKVQLIK